MGYKCICRAFFAYIIIWVIHLYFNQIRCEININKSELKCYQKPNDVNKVGLLTSLQELYNSVTELFNYNVESKSEGEATCLHFRLFIVLSFVFFLSTGLFILSQLSRLSLKAFTKSTKTRSFIENTELLIKCHAK